MTEVTTDEATTPAPAPAPRRSLLHRRGVRALLVVAALAVAVRAALPEVIRRVAVDQADKALVGRIEIDDVDLALLAGAITLHGLRVYADDLPSSETHGAGAATPQPSVPSSNVPSDEGAGTEKDRTSGEKPAALTTPTTVGGAAPDEKPVTATTPTTVAGAARDEKPVTAATPTTTGAKQGSSDATLSTEAPSEAGAVSALIFEASRLSIDIAWRPLLRKIVELESVEVEQFAAKIDRLKDGSLVLPQPVPGEPATEETPAPSQGAGWGVLLARLSLRDGRVAFRDFTLDPEPRPLEASIPSIEASNMALLLADTGLQPGIVSLDADVLGGHLRLEVAQRYVPAGQAFESHAVLTDLPISDARAYMPHVNWATLDGKLDFDLVHTFEPEGRHAVSGNAALRDLSIRVDGIDVPPLAWKKLGVDIGDVNLVRHEAKITHVTLEGARVIARASGPEPFPVLRGLLGDSETERAPTDATTATPAATGPTAPPAAASKPQPPPNSETESEPWSWRLDKVTLRDTGIELRGGDAPLDLALDADVSGLSSAPKTRSKVELKLKPPVGALALDGVFTIDPLSFDGGLKLDAVALPPLVAPVATPITRLLREGTLSTDLKIAFGATPAAPADGARVSGTVALDGFVIAGEDDKTFAVRWQQLVLDIESALAPGVLATDASSAAGQPITVALRSFDFERPEIVVTRTEQGIVLPEALTGSAAESGSSAAGEGAASERARSESEEYGSGTSESATPGDAAPTTPPSTTEPGGDTPEPTAAHEAAPGAASGEAAGPLATPGGDTPESETAHEAAPQEPIPVDVRVARLAIKNMRIGATDKAVKPLYRTSLDPIDFSATDVRWPGPYASAVNLTAKGLDGAKLAITGDVAPTGSQMKATLEGIPLAPLHPYAAMAGYGLRGGTASLRSKIKLTNESYETDNKLVLNKLQLTGAQGESMFAQQFGMPLSLALALMTDLQGNITLTLPVAGGRGGTSIGIGTAIRDALKQAILSTATSPLKLIGAVADIGQRPTSLTPQPVAFRPGRALEAEGEAAKVGLLAKFVSASPGLVLRLHGETGDEDRRWLLEQNVLAQMEKEGGLMSSLRNIGEGDEREAAMAFLRARAEDKPAELDEKAKAWLEAKIAAEKITDADLRALAEQRAEALRKTLLDSTGVAAERIVLDKVAPEDLAARAAVAISLETATAATAAESAQPDRR